MTYVLRPLNGAEGDQVELREQVPESNRESPQQCTLTSESSYAIVWPPVEEDDPEDPSGILLEANRELRIKLFMGEVVHSQYILGQNGAHLLLTGCSRMGVAHTCVPHIAQFSVI